MPVRIRRSRQKQTVVTILLSESGVLLCKCYVTHQGETMSEATFTFRVDETLKSEFTTAAKASDRTGAQLLRDFMREFIKKEQETAEYDQWVRQKVEAGRAAVAQGRVISAEEVEAEAAEWRKNLLNGRSAGNDETTMDRTRQG